MTIPADYIRRLRASGASCLTSTVCKYCYRAGGREAFFGVAPAGRKQLGSRPQDQQFRREIWNAAKNHMEEVHGLVFVSTRFADGYKLKAI